MVRKQRTKRPQPFQILPPFTRVPFVTSDWVVL
jgi:hypothetical protein